MVVRRRLVFRRRKSKTGTIASAVLNFNGYRKVSVTNTGETLVPITYAQLGLTSFDLDRGFRVKYVYGSVASDNDPCGLQVAAFGDIASANSSHSNWSAPIIVGKTTVRFYVRNPWQTDFRRHDPSRS